MIDEHIKKWHEKFQVGDLVRHYGTKQWGKVTEVRPVHYGVELVVERVTDEFHHDTGLGYWEGIRIDQHSRDGKRVW